MNFFSSSFKEKLSDVLRTKHPILITGLIGTGKLFCTKRALEDLNVDFEIIPDISKYEDILRVWKTISKAPEKNYVLDISIEKLHSAFSPLAESALNGTEVSLVTKKLNLKFVVSGKFIVVTRASDEKSFDAFKSRFYHIEG